MNCGTTQKCLDPNAGLRNQTPLSSLLALGIECAQVISWLRENYTSSS